MCSAEFIRRGDMKNLSVVFILLVTILASGCTVLLGKEDQDLQQGPAFRFVEMLRDERSLRGEGFTEVAFSKPLSTALQQPVGVYADQFRVYVVDMATQPSVTGTPRSRIFLFERGDRKVTILNGASSALDEVRLLAPSGITVDAAGVLLVSDAQQGRVFGFDRNGKCSMIIGKLGELARPAGLAADQQRNRLYVADTTAHQVKIFSLSGDHISDIGAPGKADETFKFPVAVALDRGGVLYVLDSQRKRVYSYDPDGKFKKFINVAAAKPGVALNLKSIAVDSLGRIFVVDSVGNTVLVFDQEGVLLSAWGRTGNRAGEFLSPSGIYIDGHDTIYVADQTNGRIQVFQPVK